MNSRFDSMIYHSGLIAQGCWDSFDEYDKNAIFQFYRLIVKECADIAKHNVMNISTYADAEFVDKQIKRHFGFEE